MAAKSSPNPKKKTLAQQLADLSKTILYNWAKDVGIPGRSAMTKDELIGALAKKAAKVRELLASVVPAPKEKQSTAKEILPKSAKPEAPKKKPATRKQKVLTAESTPPPVWQGEEGPELPESYGETTLRAMTKNPHTAYVYWDIDNKTGEQILQTKSHSHDPSETVLRVYGDSEKPNLEIPVRINERHTYIELRPNQTYAFEIGIRRGNEYRTLVRSNLLTLPPEPVGIEMEGGANPADRSGTAISSWQDASGVPAGKDK